MSHFIENARNSQQKHTNLPSKKYSPEDITTLDVSIEEFRSSTSLTKSILQDTNKTITDHDNTKHEDEPLV